MFPTSSSGEKFTELGMYVIGACWLKVQQKTVNCAQIGMKLSFNLKRSANNYLSKAKTVKLLFYILRLNLSSFIFVFLPIAIFKHCIVFTHYMFFYVVQYFLLSWFRRGFTVLARSPYLK